MESFGAEGGHTLSFYSKSVRTPSLMCTRLCYFEAWEHCVKTGWILFVLGMHIPMCSPYQFLGSLSSRLLWSHQPNGKPLLQGLFSQCKDSCFPLESSQLQWKNVISHVRNSRNTCSHTKYLCSSSLGTHLHSEDKDAHSMQFFQSYHKNRVVQRSVGLDLFEFGLPVWSTRQHCFSMIIILKDPEEHVPMSQH